ncbi:MAG: RnfABCDGE type electron transport complex subunit E [Proteobacteria bacterium]|nr:RnfABCDGE type electron transport complex subunit E [Pseudomonadota bacterium]NIS70486.1 RnfABCDGE type electron transport complex subunit E [Pseudomonadota bacterium]
MGVTGEFLKGLWKENPIFRLVLGMCPALAVTTAAINGIAMGLATTFVLLCSNLVVSLVRKIIPARVRLPSFIVIIATFVTIVDLVMAGFFFRLHKTLGLFIPLIVVNCVILGRAEAFASKNPIFSALADGLGMGIGFTLSLGVLGAIREVLGNGTLFSIPIMGASFLPFLVMVLPPGAFIALGFLLAAMNRIAQKS